MPICATENCGTPGRPFPACSLCNQRRYCGSHCLVLITSNMIDDIRERSNLQDAQISRLNPGMKICPPCYEIYKLPEREVEIEEANNEEEDERNL